VIPEGVLEVGVLQGLEILVRFPLLRVRLQSPGSATIGGGHLATGARRLLASGSDGAYAISAEVIVEAPTGDTRLDGNATEVTPALLAYWHPVSQFAIYSNLRFEHSIGGTGPRTAFLEYANAVAWLAKTYFEPVFEVVGSTNTISSRTQLVAQPEVVFRTGPHIELKAGVQLGLTSLTPPIGLHLQFAWLWGERR
jgi:hypothetical protein